MPIEAWIIWLAVGAISGWLAGLIAMGSGFGLIGDIVIGILGSMVAGYLFPKFGITMGGGLLSYIFSAAIGGVILLLVISLIRRIV